MKMPGLNLLPCVLAAIGLAAFVLVLRNETEACRRATETWAERDLAARTQLAAESMREPLAAGDFVQVRTFAEAHRADGLRLTVLSRPGGMVFDSDARAKGSQGDRPEVKAAFVRGQGSAIRVSSTTGRKMLYCARLAGNDFVVRLALPYESVVEPLRRNRPLLVLAGLVGASGILLVFLFTLRLVARNRALAREREVQDRLLAETRRVAEFRRDFVANVSHEIKTPLTGILGVVDLLDVPEAQMPSVDERRTLLAMLRKESTRLDALARDILSLARLERSDGEMAKRFVPADLADIVASVADRARARADAAGVKLVVGQPVPSCVSACDARLVEQAVGNLVDNAVRHAHSPDVAIALRVTDDEATFTVTDHGVGIAAADCERIFERFYRVDSARSRDEGGTGLGLAIVKHIAQLHGGSVRVDSVPGKGSVFSFSIPIVKQGDQS